MKALLTVEELGGMLSRSAQHVAGTVFNPSHPLFMIAGLPVVGYWVVAGFYELLDRCPHALIARHRVTRANPGRPNSVTRWQVVVRVLLQQLLQTFLGYLTFVADPDHCDHKATLGPMQSAVQFGIALVIMDTWQYWIHRWMHVSTFLYKHVHSTHHRLVITYAMGALYNHPIEALLLDTVGAGLAVEVAGMSCQMSAWFFLFSTIKTVFDHSGYRWPLNPVEPLFPNSAAYHDVHHDLRGIKRNYSQPFFTWWDHVCGTYLDPKRFHLTQEQLDIKLGLKAGGKDGAEPPAPAATISQDPPTQEPGVQVKQKQQEEGDSSTGGAGSEEAGSSANNTNTNGGGGENHQSSGLQPRASGRAKATPVKAAAEVVVGGGGAATGITTRSRARQQQVHEDAH